MGITWIYVHVARLGIVVSQIRAIEGLGRAADGAEMTCRCPPQVVELERHCVIYLGESTADFDDGAVPGAVEHVFAAPYFSTLRSLEHVDSARGERHGYAPCGSSS